MAAVSPRPVAADACFLINFLVVDRMDLLAGLATLRFHVPLEVVGEVLRPVEAQRLSQAIAENLVETAQIVDIREMTLLAEFLEAQLGRGESACLAVACERRWMIASDERGRFRRVATERVGTDRILTTAEALGEAVRRGLLTGADARAIADELRRTHRFAMAIPDEW